MTLAPIKINTTVMPTGDDESRARMLVRLKFDSERQLEVVLGALRPEVKSAPKGRSHSVLTKAGNSLTLEINASDSIALRASANAYLRWIEAIVNTLETIDRTAQ